MKIDSALQVFSEKYNRTAMEYIENISNDFGLNQQKNTIKAFNIKEGFEDFQDFIGKYAKYKIENIENNNATPQSMICERVESSIKQEFFKEKQILYSEIPAFIESYVSGIKNLIATADDMKKCMFESGVDPNSIGDVNNFVDSFMDVLHESLDPTMDHILWASGYNSAMRLYKPTSDSKETKAIFL